jgi:hypothetical protein
MADESTDLITLLMMDDRDSPDLIYKYKPRLIEILSSHSQEIPVEWLSITLRHLPEEEAFHLFGLPGVEGKVEKMLSGMRIDNFEILNLFIKFSKNLNFFVLLFKIFKIEFSLKFDSPHPLSNFNNTLTLFNTAVLHAPDECVSESVFRDMIACMELVYDHLLEGEGSAGEEGELLAEIVGNFQFMEPNFFNFKFFKILDKFAKFGILSPAIPGLLSAPDPSDWVTHPVLLPVVIETVLTAPTDSSEFTTCARLIGGVMDNEAILFPDSTGEVSVPSPVWKREMENRLSTAGRLGLFRETVSDWEIS